MTKASKRLAMVQLDVFSSQPLEGNPLAVFSDGRGLSDGEMQAIAREMNLSETTFILPGDAATEHPTLGTAFVFRGSTGAHEVRLDLNVGQVPVGFEESPGQPVFGEMTQLDPKFGERHDPQTVARIIGLQKEDLDDSLPIQTISTGVAFTVVALRSLGIIRSLHIDLNRMNEYLKKTEGQFFYFVTRETVDPAARLHARMLFYNGEDPATGSAAGCAAAWMVAYGVANADERVLIEQGLEMKRPSRIFVRAGKMDNRVINVRVGGNAVEVMRGEVFF